MAIMKLVASRGKAGGVFSHSHFGETIMTRLGFWRFLGLAAALAGAPALAEYPKRPVNIIVPYKAGGGTDAYARALAANTRGVLSVPLVVVNKAGSSGLTGAQAAMGARPDGYTFMMTSAGSFLLSTLLRDSGIDALESFEFVAQIGRLKTSLTVPAASPYQSAADIVAAMKAEPGKLRWGHTGRGGMHYFGGVGFLAANGLEAQDVPFKGGGPVRAALIGEQVDFGFMGVQQLRGFEDKLRGLAVNAAERDAVMSAVPAFGELNIAFADVSSPIIVFAPKGTPAEIVETMRAALEKIAAKPEFAEMLEKRGTAPVYASGEQARQTLAAMKTAVAPLVAKAKK